MSNIHIKRDFRLALEESARRLAAKPAGLEREYPISDEWDLRVAWGIFWNIPQATRIELLGKTKEGGMDDVEIEELLLDFVRRNALRITCENEHHQIAAAAGSVC